MEDLDAVVVSIYDSDSVAGRRVCHGPRPVELSIVGAWRRS